MCYNFIHSTADSQDNSSFLQSYEEDSTLATAMKQLMITKINEYYGEDCG